MTYYQRILQQCKRKGVTEGELCEKLGISRQKLHSLNRGFILGKPDVLEVDLHY